MVSRKRLAWLGLSQTGKSVLLGSQVDGDKIDGSDSALTWDSSQKIRFSDANKVPTGTLILNPHHQGSDASGLSTRYTLKKPKYSEYPNELVISNRRQIIHALAAGYLSACLSDYQDEGEKLTFTSASFKAVLEEYNFANLNELPQRNAYELLDDIANVLNNMGTFERFENLCASRNGKKEFKLRTELVSCIGLHSNFDNALKFAKRIFWDSSPKLSQLYDDLIKIMDELARWRTKQIYVSPAATAILLDITSYTEYTNFNKNSSCDSSRNYHQAIYNAVCGFAYQEKGNEVFVDVVAPGTADYNFDYSGKKFGLFQAIVAELAIPLNEDHLQAESKKAFLESMRRTDILDIPGVPNSALGSNAGDTNLVDLSEATEAQLLCNVFKQGKTLTIVYGYINQYKLDAFMVMARIKKIPPNVGIVNNGVEAWIRSFSPDWKPRASQNMPLFFNLTFFAELVKNYNFGNGSNRDLSPIVNIIDKYSFAYPAAARFFITNYPYFPDGELKPDDTKTDIMGDSQMHQATGLSSDEIKSALGPSGGVERIFAQTALVSTEQKRIACQKLVENDCNRLSEKLLDALPKSDEAGYLKKQVMAIRDRVFENLESNGGEKNILRMRYLLDTLFSLSFDQLSLTPIPLQVGILDLDAVRKYIEEQVITIKKHIIGKINANPDKNLIFMDEQLNCLLRLLFGSEQIELMANYLRCTVGDIRDSNASRSALVNWLYPLIGNIIKFGTCQAEDPNGVFEESVSRLETFTQGHSPVFQSIYENKVKPFICRLDRIIAQITSIIRPDQPGDMELQQLYQRLQQVGEVNRLDT